MGQQLGCRSMDELGSVGLRGIRMLKEDIKKYIHKHVTSKEVI